MLEIAIPSQNIKVLAESGCGVCGGGPAGITAAVSAARHRASVVLLERWPSVGGMATNALSTSGNQRPHQAGDLGASAGGPSSAAAVGSAVMTITLRRPDTMSLSLGRHAAIRLPKNADEAGCAPSATWLPLESVAADGQIRACAGGYQDRAPGDQGIDLHRASGDGDIAANPVCPSNSE